MVQQHQLQPLVHSNSMSSEEGRLSSGDLDTKVGQYLCDDEDPLIHTMYALYTTLLPAVMS